MSIKHKTKKVVKGMKKIILKYIQWITDYQYWNRPRNPNLGDVFCSILALPIVILISPLILVTLWLKE